MQGSVRSQLLQVQVQVDGNREMSDQHADFAIELNEIGDASVPDRCSARHPDLKASAKVASNHTAVLRKDSPAVARTIRELAARIHAID
jgi:hypothetical protein